MKFDTLEIQKNIEEKRLVLGKKIEGFLLQKSRQISEAFVKILAAKNSAFLGSLIIIAISILARSTRDFGHDSAAYLEIAQKILSGGKYYDNFFEANFPLCFILAVISRFLAMIFSIHPIFVSEFLSNFVGILSLYFSAKILAKSRLVADKKIFNLVILSFACGFFLRVFTLQFDEFATKSTLLLAFLFPYLSYQLLDENKLKKSDQITIGILAALLFCLKPHYGIFVLVFELEKLFKSKSLRASFCLRNYTTLAVLFGYFLLLVFYFPDFLQAAPIIFEHYYQEAGVVIFPIVKSDFFPLFLFSFLNYFLIRKNELLQKLFLVSCAAAILVMLELIGGPDQIFVFYSMSLPLTVLTLFFIVKNKLINWKKDGIFLLLILIVPQFDKNNFFALALDLCAFWPVFVLFLMTKWRREKNNYDDFLSKIFLPHNAFSWIIFALLTCATIVLFCIRNYDAIAWIFSAILFSLLIFFDQKSSREKFYSTLASCSIFFVLAHTIAWNIGSVFDYHSPNHVNSEMIKLTKTMVSNEENVLIVADSIPGSYPFRIYANKENELPFLHFAHLFFNRKDEPSKVLKYSFNLIKSQIGNKKNKLLFIEQRGRTFDQWCDIGFLERSFFDKEFGKIFLQNYRFLTRISETRTSPKIVKFFGEDGQYEEAGRSEIIEREVEVYVRK